ncbi:MAG TPA: nickel-dependent lactate racemase [Candidatus Aminicenantes bacterium]|nr:nickel-dependent lactate racemase [Candidatus Aminicenantes bacterium]HRY64534.1 nickel-dependent lactate racemase [Candidatus Aminicenantes bacterium]HRZ71447.1 nickel-dependent lactate racemase [Candidatus Aminicenantes bacterium]
MRLNLAYGKTGLPIELDDSLDITVVEPSFVPALPDPAAAVRAALEAPLGSPPLRSLLRPGLRVGVVFSDITRPAPNPLLLGAVLEVLDSVPGVEATLFNALGTHRPNTEAELRGMLGDAVFERRRIVQNDAFDPATQVRVGLTSRGHEAWLNAELMRCDLKVLTGFIEPHLFAGFSGGGKAILPGMAGQRTVLGNHDAGMIGNPQAIWGVTRGNPVWEEVREVAGQAGRLFLLNVTLNRDKAVTGVFAGDLDRAHAEGCAFVRRSAMVAVPRPFDIVVTTNSGYPLDLNLYQSIKGLRAAEPIVRPGGAVIIATSCWDGIPEHGLYGALLRRSKSPRELLDRITAPGFLEQDQWQAHIQALVQQKAEVYVRSDGLTDDQIRSALLRPCRRVEDTVEALLGRYGRGASICVMPEGPQTIPYIA